MCATSHVQTFFLELPYFCPMFMTSFKGSFKVVKSSSLYNYEGFLFMEHFDMLQNTEIVNCSESYISLKLVAQIVLFKNCTSTMPLGLTFKKC